MQTAAERLQFSLLGIRLEVFFEVFGLCFFNRFFLGVALGTFWVPFWSLLEPLGGLLGRLWGPLGLPWAPLGITWAPLGLSWASLGEFWAILEAFLEPQVVPGGAEWVYLEADASFLVCVHRFLCFCCVLKLILVKNRKGLGSNFSEG